MDEYIGNKSMTINEFVEKRMKNIELHPEEEINPQKYEVVEFYHVMTKYGKLPFAVLFKCREKEVLESKTYYPFYGHSSIEVDNVEFSITPISKVFKRNGKFYLQGYKVAELGDKIFIAEEGRLLDASEAAPEEHINLSNGKVLMNKFGKYEPNLCFISALPYLMWEHKEPKEFNLDRGSFSVLRGSFFISKKGTKCFRIEEKGQHILIRDGWGGAFEKYRGGTLPEEQALYYRRASSNGGGCGYDYAIYPHDWRYLLSEEDI